MWRIIEILKNFQYSFCIDYEFLTNTFEITDRTLWRDIVFINKSLKKIGNCKISKKQKQLIFIGNDKIQCLNTLFAQFIQTANDSNPFIRINNLLLVCVWQKNYLSYSALANMIGKDNYSLKKDIIFLNNYLFKQKLNVKLIFKYNQGLKLNGCEKDLRFITTSILINQYNNHNYTLYQDKILIHIFNNIKNILINDGYKTYNINELVCFLVVTIRRIKINCSLKKCHFTEFPINNIIKQDVNNFILLMNKHFNIKLSVYEINYLRAIVLINTKINNDLFPEVIKAIDKITNNILSIISNQYQLLLHSNSSFQEILNEFLINNWFKLLFEFYNIINFQLDNYFELQNNYEWGKQILLIVNFYLKRIKHISNINLLNNKYLMIAFNNIFIPTKNWNIPLHIMYFDDPHIKNQITQFISNTFPNVTIKFFENDLDNIFKLHLLNQNFTILFKKYNLYSEYNLIQYQNISIINIYQESWNYQLENNIATKIKLVMLKTIQQSIIIFNFYTHESFYNLKSLLWKFQTTFIKKYKLLNLVFLELDEASIFQNYFRQKILLIHQVIPFPNNNIPIILIYLQKPLIFRKKYPINFVFILLSNVKTTQNYQWLVLWLKLFEKIVSSPIKKIKDLDKIIQSVI